MDDKKVLLDKLRFHWYSYLARGGFNGPKITVGKLEKGGLMHWTLFLQTGRTYLREYPKDRHIVEAFVPENMVRLLTGE